jgi:hypothetical protein
VQRLRVASKTAVPDCGTVLERLGMQTNSTPLTTRRVFKIQKAATCLCNAYKFPHRAGGGDCEDPGENPGKCSECKFGREETDPFGTGDRWYSEWSCENGGCYWG